MSFTHMRLPRGVVLSMALAALFTGMTSAGSSLAQDWPNRPVTMVVPYGPGASNDTFTRAISEVLSKQLGQPFVVDNRPGAGGFTGSNYVAHAAPDGYTFLEIPNSIVAFKPVLGVDLDPLKDLTPITTLARSPSVMVVPASLPVHSVKEFIAYAKAHPDDTFYGYGGIGATQHQTSLLFLENSGLKLRGVNYKSSADAQTDLIAGRLQLMFPTLASVVGQIKGGQLRLLAYTAPINLPGTPQAPTMAEEGVPGMDKIQIWWSIFGPPGLPKDLQMKMNAAVREALKDPSVATLMAKSGATPSPSTVEDFVAEIKNTKAFIDNFIKKGYIKPRK